MMSEVRRQHPVAAIAQFLQLVKQHWITLILLIFVGTGESSWGTYIVLLVAVLGSAGGVISWWRFTYHVENGELHITKGLFVRKQLSISKDRIQVIDITAGLVQRFFDLVSVEVKTAGASSKEAKIDAVTKGEAGRIKHLLRKDDDEASGEEASLNKQEYQHEKVYALSSRDLMIAALTSGNIGIMASIVAGFYSQVDQVIGEEQMIGFFEWLMPAAMSAHIIFGLIFVLLIISWILSTAGSLIKNYGFTLRVRDDELHITHGLFEQKQLTIPFDRIQALQIKEELFRQPFGYASLALESAGYGGDEKQQLNSTTLFPLLKKKEVAAFIADVIPQYSMKPKLVEPPAVALRRYLLRKLWVSLLFIGPMWYFSYGWYAVLILLPGAWLGYMQYRDARIGATNNTIWIRRRLLSRYTAIVKKHRVQTVDTKANPFQRRLQLADYDITVASGSGGQSFAVRDIRASDARLFYEWGSRRGNKKSTDEESPVL